MIDKIRKRALKLTEITSLTQIRKAWENPRRFSLKSKGALKLIPFFAVESLQARYLSTGSRIIR